MIKGIVREFFSFIKRPNDYQIDISISKKIIYVLFLISVNLIISYSIIIPILERIDETELLNSREYENASTIKIFLILVILTPFIEEFFFRYFLRYKSYMTNFLTIEKWNKIFPVLVYSSTVCFALIHLTNFSNNSLLFYILSPIIVLSQTITGLIITFIRIRFSFILGVIYHWIWNLIVIFIIPIIEEL